MHFLRTCARSLLLKHATVSGLLDVTGGRKLVVWVQAITVIYRRYLL